MVTETGKKDARGSDFQVYMQAASGAMPIPMQVDRGWTIRRSLRATNEEYAFTYPPCTSPLNSKPMQAPTL